MKQAESLKDFLRYMIALVGAGYTNVLIVKIPEKKLLKIEVIRIKVRQAYQTDLTRSQRAYRKSKGYANFQAVSYRKYIYVLRTSGEINSDIILGKGFISFKKKNSLDLVISDYLTLILFKDERNKLTIRLSKKNYQDFKNRFQQAYIHRSGSQYHSTLKRLMNLPSYRGLQLQKIALIQYLREQHKVHGVSWSIPFKL